MKLSDYAKQHSVTYRTAWNRFKRGQIPGAYKDHTGHVIVPERHETDNNRVAIYSRVSTPGQKEDLHRQTHRLKEFATANGWVIDTVVEEIASGVKDNRKKLTKLLTSDGEWAVLLVEHKDRLSRVGFNWFPTLLENQGKRVVVADETTDSDEGRMEDIFSILYSYAASEYGRRGAKNRAERAARELSKKE